MVAITVMRFVDILPSSGRIKGAVTFAHHFISNNEPCVEKMLTSLSEATTPEARSWLASLCKTPRHSVPQHAAHDGFSCQFI